MESYTLVGALVAITTAFLGIFSLIVKYFVDALNRKDVRGDTLTDSVIQVNKDTATSNLAVAEALNKVAEASKASVEASKTSTDQLSQLFMQAIEKKQNN